MTDSEPTPIASNPRWDGRRVLFEVADGDHSFKTRVKVTGRKPDAVLGEILDAVAAFVRAPAY